MNPPRSVPQRLLFHQGNLGTIFPIFPWSQSLKDCTVPLQKVTNRPLGGQDVLNQLWSYLASSTETRDRRWKTRPLCDLYCFLPSFHFPFFHSWLSKAQLSFYCVFRTQEPSTVLCTYHIYFLTPTPALQRKYYYLLLTQKLKCLAQGHIANWWWDWESDLHPSEVKMECSSTQHRWQPSAHIPYSNSPISLTHWQLDSCRICVLLPKSDLYYVYMIDLKITSFLLT